MLEDYTSHSPVVLLPAVFEKRHLDIRAPDLGVHGGVSSRLGFMNVIVNRIWGIGILHALPPSRSRR